MTKMFQYNLVKSQKTPETYVLPEGNDDRIIMAASRLIEMDVVDISLATRNK
jgi:phosphate acetyltransferase